MRRTLAFVLLIALADGVIAQPIPLARSRPLIREFARKTGFPNGRPGYVVDHEIPLCAGGPDRLDNLQWQEVGASYVKDVFERELCRDMQRLRLTMIERAGDSERSNERSTDHR